MVVIFYAKMFPSTLISIGEVVGILYRVAAVFSSKLRSME